jgi:catechol 2,3-dioxygenase-like lactoylglutathione lyase family enzyme
MAADPMEKDMTEATRGKARLIGINHVALEVGDIDQALAFYGSVFDFELRGRSKTMAFIDMGDQFIALATGRSQPKDSDRHFGLVVDDRASLRSALEQAGAEILPGRGLDFLDPWGNHIQVVEYRDIQYTKAPEILDAMALGDLGKSEQALKELADKGVRVS